MRKVLWAVLSIAFLLAIFKGGEELSSPPLKVHAFACTSLTPGQNAAQIQTVLNACSSGGGGTVNAPAGSYSLLSTVTLPCNVSISGPILPFSQNHYQTAIFNGSSSYSGLPIHTSTGCSTTQSIQYVEWNGQRPTNGGGFIYVTSGTTNLLISNNYIHGNNAAAYAENINEGGVVLDGTTSSAVTQNVTITLNEFGPESLGDCGYPGGAMGETNTEGGGGFCAGVLLLAQTKNVTITSNWFHNLEQGAKIIEASSGHGNSQLFTMEKNSFTGISRIDFETQSNLGDTTKPTFQNIRWNYLGDRAPNGQFNFDLSIANGCGSALNCTAHMDYNVDIQISSANGRGGGNEFWGDSNSTGNSNWFEGYVANAIGGVITWSQTGQFNFNNNIFNVIKGGTTDCTTGTSGYWSKETGNNPAFSPTCVGNSYSTVGSGTITSQSPTISPNGGVFSGSQLVTLACSTCTNREANTSFWYTTDGSTPVAGVSTLYTAPFLVSPPTTVKVIGMWGAINQPYSYPSGYGYLPSSVITANFASSGGGGVTLTSVLLVNDGGATTLQNGSTNGFHLQCRYSDGSNFNCTGSPDAYGNQATFNSTNTAVGTISNSTGLFTAVGIGTSNVTGTAGSFTSTPITMNVQNLLMSKPVGRKNPWIR